MILNHNIPKKSTRHKPTLISPHSQPYTSTPSQLHHLHAHVSLPKKISLTRTARRTSLFLVSLSHSFFKVNTHVAPGPFSHHTSPTPPPRTATLAASALGSVLCISVASCACAWDPVAATGDVSGAWWVGFVFLLFGWGYWACTVALFRLHVYVGAWCPLKGGGAVVGI